MQPQSRIKFSDLQRIKKDQPFPEGVNAIPLEAVKMAKDASLVDAFEEIENNRWFGTLEGKGMTFSFRHGVCQSFTKRGSLFGYDFNMNIINDRIDFHKEPKGKI
jgi:hypothetical protein